MKKFLSFLLILSLIMPGFVLQACAFSDVPSDAWYADAVGYAVNSGLFQGTGANTFTPNGTMTRGMFVTVLGRLAGVSTSFTAAGTVTKSAVNMRADSNTGSARLALLDRNTAVEVLGISNGWYKVRYQGLTGYIRSDLMSACVEGLSDVSYTQYYAPYVSWAFQCGIASGTTSSTFSPEQPITREDICVYLTRYCSYYGLVLPVVREATAFSDAAQIHDLEAVQALQAAGIIEGRDDGRFDGQASVKRCEVAALFQRYSNADVTASTPEAPESTYSGYQLFGNIPPQTSPASESYFDDACFIGHSLVVGMKNYFALPHADYYAISGISASRMLTYDRFPLNATYKDENGNTQHELGTISDVLNEHHYGKIYVMLGVNELGPETDHLNMYYSSMLQLTEKIKAAQPQATIYLISITPISKARSEASANFNRENALRFNDKLQQVSLDKNVYYIDAFGAFTDADGYMPESCVAADGIHLLASQYAVLKNLLLSYAV